MGTRRQLVATARRDPAPVRGLRRGHATSVITLDALVARREVQKPRRLRSAGGALVRSFGGAEDDSVIQARLPGIPREARAVVEERDLAGLENDRLDYRAADGWKLISTGRRFHCQALQSRRTQSP